MTKPVVYVPVQEEVSCGTDYELGNGGVLLHVCGQEPTMTFMDETGNQLKMDEGMLRTLGSVLLPWLNERNKGLN